MVLGEARFDSRRVSDKYLTVAPHGYDPNMDRRRNSWR